MQPEDRRPGPGSTRPPADYILALVATLAAMLAVIVEMLA